MIISQHAEVRSKQRGISNESIMLLKKFGRRSSRPGGVVEYSLDKRGRQTLQRLLPDSDYVEKLRHQVVICSRTDLVITCYYRD